MNIQKIFEKTVKKYNLVKDGDRILVAISGGKDSAAMYYLLKKYVERKRINVELKPFHINLGFNIDTKIDDVVVFDLKDNYGFYLQDAKKLKRPICAVCGTIKRYILNKYARENGFNKIATGHTSSDISMFFLKNIMSGNYQYNSSLKPISRSRNEKIITRIKPMFFISDKSIRNFCEKNNVSYIKKKCPFSPNDRIKKLVHIADEMNNELSFSIARYVSSLPERRKIEFKYCKICGEPTTQDICAFCKIRKSLGKI